jgi:hypothetical protein
MIEFAIMAVLLLGFAIPVISGAFFDIISQIDFAHIFNSVPLADGIN